MADEAATAEAPAEPVAAPEPIVSALVVADGRAVKKAQGLVISAEVRGDQGEPVPVTYGAGAALYLRITDDLDMGCAPEQLLTLGVDLAQTGFNGLSETPGAVHVGPAHPAYAALNLAYSRGARSVEIAGLSQTWKDRFQPYVDALGPYGVAVTLT